MAAKQRVYTAFARPVDKVPNPRHGRKADCPSREKITRPATATPRNAADWS